MRELEREGFEVTYLDVKPDGLLDLEKFKAALRPDTILVVGDAREQRDRRDPGHPGDRRDLPRQGHHLPRRRARRPPARSPIDLAALKVDLMSFSAHKTYGPKGIGALFVRRKPRVRIEAQMHGGGHERGMRSGTLADAPDRRHGRGVPLARLEMAAENERIRMLRDRLRSGPHGHGRGVRERRHGAARAAQPQHQLQLRRGRSR